jgi:hypothetical protein
MRTLNS